MGSFYEKLRAGNEVRVLDENQNVVVLKWHERDPRLFLNGSPIDFFTEWTLRDWVREREGRFGWREYFDQKVSHHETLKVHQEQVRKEVAKHPVEKRESKPVPFIEKVRETHAKAKAEKPKKPTKPKTKTK